MFSQALPPGQPRTPPPHPTEPQRTIRNSRGRAAAFTERSRPSSRKRHRDSEPAAAPLPLRHGHSAGHSRDDMGHSHCKTRPRLPAPVTNQAPTHAPGSRPPWRKAICVSRAVDSDLDLMRPRLSCDASVYTTRVARVVVEVDRPRVRVDPLGDLVDVPGSGKTRAHIQELADPGPGQVRDHTGQERAIASRSGHDPGGNFGDLRGHGQVGSEGVFAAQRSAGTRVRDAVATGRTRPSPTRCHPARAAAPRPPSRPPHRIQPGPSLRQVCSRPSPFPTGCWRR